MEIEGNKIVEGVNGKHVEFTLTFSAEEISALTLMLGMAMGTASRENMTELSYQVLRMANKIHEVDPSWVPYQLPEVR